MSFSYALTARGTSYVYIIDNNFNNIINYACNCDNNNYNSEIIIVNLDSETLDDVNTKVWSSDGDLSPGDIDTTKYKKGNFPSDLYVYRDSENSDGGLMIKDCKPLPIEDVDIVKYKLGSYPDKDDIARL